MIDQNVRITGETHAALVTYTQQKDLKLGKLADRLIKEGIERLRTLEAPTLERLLKEKA